MSFTSRRTRGPAIGSETVRTLREGLGDRSIVLIGLMGAGKSSVGRRLAACLELPFVDADDEIEAAAGKSISDIFEEHGEDYFRDGERRVIHRLLKGGPQILATGGGAFMNSETRQTICENGIAVWLKADVELLAKRVRRRNTRPLLQGKDVHAVLSALMRVRHPVYGEADFTIESKDVPHEVIVSEIVSALSQSSVLRESGRV